MSEDTALVGKRAQLRGDMEAYCSLGGLILDKTGGLAYKLSQRLTPGREKDIKPAEATEGLDRSASPSLWYSGIAIWMIMLLVGLLTSKVLREPLSSREIQLVLWAGATGTLALVANQITVQMFLDTFRGTPLDKMESIADLRDLDKWLRRNFDIKKPLLAGVLLGPFLGLALYLAWLVSNPESFHVGPCIVAILASFMAAIVIYYLYPFFVALPARLSGYHFDLYTTDPSSSEVVGRLSQLLTYIMYIAIAYVVLLTLGLTYFNILTLETGLFFGLMVWVPTVLLYGAGQFRLSGLISQAKWKMLNEVQSKIESLHAKEDIPDKETLERLEKLMDYHDRIKGTPNSALNFRAGLNFLNSLLFPVLAFVLANIDIVIGFFKGIGGQATSP